MKAMQPHMSNVGFDGEVGLPDEPSTPGGGSGSGGSSGTQGVAEPLQLGSEVLIPSDNQTP